ncbi:MAG: sulfotransferase [Oleibacter sp.]|nr:sulfotransferase [Thalassolituus sp.]
MSTENMKGVKFNNILSKILLTDNFKYQFTIPTDKSPRAMKMFDFIERKVIKMDLDAVEIDRPIFIVSLPRTGSTMLQNVMCKQSNIGYFSQLMNNYYPYFAPMDKMQKKFDLNFHGERFIGDSVMVDVTGPSDPIHIWNSWIRKDPFVAQYKHYRKEDLSKDQIDEIHTSIKKALWCQGGEKNRFLIKSPGILAYLPLVNDLFPDAKFIHLIRDPRDCANSLIKLTKKSLAQIKLISENVKDYKHAGKTPVSYPHVPNLVKYIDEFGIDDIRTAAHVCKDSIEIVEAYKANLKSFYEVRYEDILADPENKMREILEFCELPEPPASNKEYWDLLGGVGTVSHKNNYTDQDVVEDICSDVMQRYGYSVTEDSEKA